MFYCQNRNQSFLLTNSLLKIDLASDLLPENSQNVFSFALRSKLLSLMTLVTIRQLTKLNNVVTTLLLHILYL